MALFGSKKGFFETGRVLFLSVETLRPNPNQPRTLFSDEGLDELSASIREHGILQPLSVRKAEGGYELVSGERRLRAAKRAGLKEVPCIVVDVDPESSSLLALVENLQRRDLDFLEEAARRIGKSQSAVANKLRLLRLPQEALTLLRENGLTERHARALLRLEDPQQQMAVLRQVIIDHLTVAKTEAYIDALLSPPPVKKRKPTYIIKDVRLFLNTVTRGLSMMKHAGVNADCARQETEDSILLTIRIPKCG